MSYALEVSDLTQSAERLADDLANMFPYNQQLLEAMGEVLELLSYEEVPPDGEADDE